MRAFSQSRWIVRSHTSFIAAISANEKPQKNFKSTTSAREGSALASWSSASLIRVSSRQSGIFSFGAKRRDFELTAALLRTATSRVINDQTPHYASGITHESVAIRKGRSLSAGDFDVGLM